ncbi:Mas-related G-protein coupled receptor member H, partial [Anas platyrhynchos]
TDCEADSLSEVPATLLICLCGLVGNGAVLWLLGCRIRRNPITVYVFSLAIADFTFLLSIAIALVMFYGPLSFCHRLGSRDVMAMLNIIIIFVFTTSIYLLAAFAISVDRCVSVFFPIWYRCYRPRHLSGIVSGLLWAFAGAFVSSMYLSFHFRVTYEEVFGGIGIAIIVTLSSVMLISNLSLFIKLRCGFQRRHPGKLYVAVLLNVIFFFVLAIPFSIEVFLNLNHRWHLFPNQVPFLLALLNSNTNPIVYFLVGSCQRGRIQGSLKAAFRQVFEEKAVSAEG